MSSIVRITAIMLLVDYTSAQSHPTSVSDKSSTSSLSRPGPPPHLTSARIAEEGRVRAWSAGHPCRDSCLEEHRRASERERLVLELVEPAKVDEHHRQTAAWQHRITQHWEHRRDPLQSHYIPKKIDPGFTGFKTLKNLHMTTMIIRPSKKGVEAQQRYLQAQHDKRQGIINHYLAEKGVADDDVAGEAENDANQAPHQPARNLPSHSTFHGAILRGSQFQEEWPQGILKRYTREQQRALTSTVKGYVDANRPHDASSMHLEPWRLESEPERFAPAARRLRRYRQAAKVREAEQVGQSLSGSAAVWQEVEHALSSPKKLP